MNFPENKNLSLGVLILLLFAGCSSDNNNNTFLEPVTRLTISPSITTVPVGGTAQVKTGDTCREGLPLLWTIDDTNVATVSTEGVVLGKSLGVATVSASCGEVSATANVSVVSPSRGAANLSVSGFAFYEDKPYDDKGFTGAIVKTPIKAAVVNLIALDGLTPLISTTTEADGSYKLGPVNNSVRRGGVYLQVLAKTNELGFNPIVIMDNATNKNILAVRGIPLDDSITGSFSSDVVASVLGMGGAFNILDTLLKGGEFIQSAGCPPPAPCKAMPLLTVYWTRGTKTNTFYESHPVNAISINGGQMDTRGVIGDADEYDDAIVAHEYGHFMADTFSRDDSKGGAHTFHDSAEDIRLAWSEGWATFFAAASLGNPLYVDTQGQGRFVFNMETLTDRYTTSEAAVSRVLWDIFDTPLQDQDNDPMTTGFAPVWKAVMAMNDPAAPGISATMESFVMKFTEQNPANAAALQTLLKGAGIELFPDATENQETELILNVAQHHTLYATGPDPFSDMDRIRFSVIAGRTYTVRTLNLTNGADTFLSLEGSSQSNDNANGTTYPTECNTACPRNDQTTLSSSLSFPAGTTGTLFVRVTRSPAAPNSAGRAGSYDIQLTSP